MFVGEFALDDLIISMITNVIMIIKYQLQVVESIIFEALQQSKYVIQLKNQL